MMVTVRRVSRERVRTISEESLAAQRPEILGFIRRFNFESDDFQVTSGDVSGGGVVEGGGVRTAVKRLHASFRPKTARPGAFSDVP